jgi:hypothetical protein
VPDGLNARHPDFARLAVRIGRAIGRGPEAVAALLAAESDKSLFNLENDFMGAALLDLLKAAPFRGNAAELLTALVAADSSLEGKLSAKRLAKRLTKLWPHLEAVFSARYETDTHSKEKVYSMNPPGTVADFADFQSAFSEKSHGEENNRTLPKTLFETPQTPHENRPPNEDGGSLSGTFKDSSEV